MCEIRGPRSCTVFRRNFKDPELARDMPCANSRTTVVARILQAECPRQPRKLAIRMCSPECKCAHPQPRNNVLRARDKNKTPSSVLAVEGDRSGMKLDARCLSDDCCAFQIWGQMFCDGKTLRSALPLFGLCTAVEGRAEQLRTLNNSRHEVSVPIHGCIGPGRQASNGLRPSSGAPSCIVPEQRAATGQPLLEHAGALYLL